MAVPVFAGAAALSSLRPFHKAKEQSASAAAPAAESALSAAARELAQKVTAAGTAAQGQLTVAANPRNLSNISQVQFEQGVSAFRDELAKLKKAQTGPAANADSAAATAPANAASTNAAAGAAASAATVSVALSENLAGYLWVAQLTQGNATQALFVSVPHELVSQSKLTTASVVLEKEFVLSLPEQILDVEVLPGPAGSEKRALVLEPESVALYVQSQGAWQRESQAPIAHANSWPRDMRGMLELTGDAARARMPGVDCEIAVDAVVTAVCQAGNEGWALSPGFARAFTLLPITTDQGDLFTFVTLGAQEFDSLAVIGAPPSSGAPAPIVGTTPDGRALLFDGSGTPVGSFAGWGSDIAALYSANRNQWPLLVTGAGDWTAADTIQAFEISDGEATPASSVINFDGPVMALWTKGEDSAVAIVRNLNTGMYEAYVIRASYSQ